MEEEKPKALFPFPFSLKLSASFSSRLSEKAHSNGEVGPELLLYKVDFNFCFRNNPFIIVIPKQASNDFSAFPKQKAKKASLITQTKYTLSYYRVVERYSEELSSLNFELNRHTHTDGKEEPTHLIMNPIIIVFKIRNRIVNRLYP